MVRKTCTFDYEESHRPGKSIGHPDGLSRIPSNSINAIEADLPSTSNQKEIPRIATAFNNYQEIIGNVFDSKDSIAHCVSTDFKMFAGIADFLNANSPQNIPLIFTIPTLRYGSGGYMKRAVTSTI